MAEGDFAQWSSSLTGSPTIVAAGSVVALDTEVVRDPLAYSLASSSRATVTETGRYLVRWDAGMRRNPAAGAPTRALVQGTIRKNGTSFLTGGRAVGYWRQAEACDEGGLCSGVIVDLVAGDYLELFLQRLDSAGAAGATLLGSTSNLTASLGLWRLKSTWQLIDLETDADATDSDVSPQTIALRILSREGGWALAGNPGDLVTDALFDAVAGALGLDLLFLACFSIEADESAGFQGLLEGVLEYAPPWVLHPTFHERVRVTSYAEGLQSCTKATPTWCGLIDALQGEGDNAGLRLRYLHRNSTQVAFTPKASKVRLQALAIPKGDIDYVQAREQSGGQAASVSNPVSFDATVHEDASWDHNPGDAAPTKVRAVGDGQWAMVFAAAYARPQGGDRADQRLSHQLELRIDDAGLTYGGAVSMDRGSSAACDRSGLGVSGIVKVPAGSDLTLYHEQKASG